MRFLGLLLAILFWQCGSNSPGSKIVADTGPNIFKKNCITCHGIDGRLQMNGAKDLHTSTLNLEERLYIIKNGKGVMTPFRDVLTDIEIERVAIFSQTFSDSLKYE